MTREPRGDRRIDVNFAWLIYSIRRTLGDSKVELKDCLLSFERKTEQLDEAEKNKQLAGAFRIFAKNQRDRRSKKK